MPFLIAIFLVVILAGRERDLYIGCHFVEHLALSGGMKQPMEQYMIALKDLNCPLFVSCDISPFFLLTLTAFF